MPNQRIFVSPKHSEFNFSTKRNWRTDGQYEPFVYLIQEVDTEKMYIGSKTAKGCLESDLGTRYFTSSKEIDWASNPNDFEICKVIPCASNHDAIILEYQLIKENFAVYDDNFFNRNNNSVEWNTSGMKREFSEEYRMKLSLAKKGNKKTQDHKNKISAANKEFRKRNPDFQRGEQNPNYGKQLSQETKDKIGAKNKGQTRNDEFCEFLSSRNKEFYKDKNNHPMYNKHHTEESKEKIRESSKGRVQPLRKCPHCNKEGRTGAMSRFHFDNCKHNPDREVDYISCPKCNQQSDKRNISNFKPYHFDNCKNR